MQMIVICNIDYIAWLKDSANKPINKWGIFLFIEKPEKLKAGL